MKLLLTICIVVISGSISAQRKSPDPDPRYKQYTGRYGTKKEGIFLFDDGIYFLTSPTNVVVGHYTLKGDSLIFKVDRPDLFYVYASKNPALGDSVRINFQNFEETQAFVQFNKEKVNRVFNDSAGCFDQPFVYQRPGSIHDLTLSYKSKTTQADQSSANSWHYKNDKGYNEFMAVINTPKNNEENFEAKRILDEKGIRLEVSIPGNHSSYLGQDTTTRIMQEALYWKNYYLQLKQLEVLYANKHYWIATPDISKYVLDPETMIYDNKVDKENMAYHDKLTDTHHLRAFSKIQPADKVHATVPVSEATSCIFYSACGEGMERSYRYTGLKQHKQEDDEVAPAIIIAPPVTQPTKP